MSKYYLAVDIGASSGRHILGSLEDGKMTLEEIYRFENGMKKKSDGHLCWDIEALKTNILEGLKKCKKIGKIPESMGIDTWAVDYVLLDEKDQILGNTYGYRDLRTTGMDDQVYEIISPEDLYKRTGIQKQIFNTIYQLMAVKQQEPELMEKAKTLLMIPDYFNFILTGKKLTEYTNASTTQLVSPATRQWDDELIEMLGYNRQMLTDIVLPASYVGNFTKEIRELVGFDCRVILPATHDTGAAVMAVPANDDDYLYISSGTWSLMGIERLEADCSIESMQANFTNEGGYNYRFRYLKNIMGLWMIQSVRNELNKAYSFAQLCEMANESTDFPSRVDVNDQVFLAPESMIDAIKNYCRNTDQQVPETVSQIAAVVYQSLGKSYGETVEEIERITGRTYSRIHIVGGGANAEYLNQLTARYTKKAVHAGPTEATAIGNLAAQMIESGDFNSLTEARTCIYESFSIKTYNAVD